VPPHARAPAIPESCRWCREITKASLPAPPPGAAGLTLPCRTFPGALKALCDGFRRENTVRLRYAVDPDTVCVTLNHCTPQQAHAARAGDAARARELADRVSMMRVLSGHVGLAASMKTFVHMKEGYGKREVRHRVQFSSPFNRPPIVHVGASGVEFDGDSAMKYKLVASHVDRYGFDLMVSTWGTARLDRITAGWVAYARGYQPRGLMRSGTFVASDRSTSRHTVTFPVPFDRVPQVTASLSGIDSEIGAASGLLVQVSSVNEDGFVLDLTTSGTGASWSEISWLATSTSAGVTSGHVTLGESFPGYRDFALAPGDAARQFSVKVPLTRSVRRVCNGVEVGHGEAERSTSPDGTALSLVDVDASLRVRGDGDGDGDIDNDDAGGDGGDPAGGGVDADGCETQVLGKVKFVTIPDVAVMVSGFNLRDGAAPRVEVEVADVSKTHATFRVLAWGGTRLPSFSFGWVAHDVPAARQRQKREFHMVNALNNAMSPGISCRGIAAKGMSRGNGNYWTRLPGHQWVTLLFCDMVDGGWTRVVNIRPDVTTHASTGAVAPERITDYEAASKLSDADINNLVTTGYLRVLCGRYKAHVRSDGGAWTSERNNGLKWSIARRAVSTDKLEFDCDATSPGNTFSEGKDAKDHCKNGYVSYAAQSEREGTGCYHEGEGWEREGSLWAM
jgi:hypothetical protein